MLADNFQAGVVDQAKRVKQIEGAAADVSKGVQPALQTNGIALDIAP